MADLLQDSLNVQGFASEIVMLKQPKPLKRGTALALAAGVREAVSGLAEVAEERAARLAKHFTAPREAQSAALATLLGRRKPRTTMKLYANLGLMLGVVDARGLSNLRKSSDVQAVNAAPVLSLIRPVAEAPLAAAMPGRTWGIERLGVQRVWDVGFTGKDVIVGHLDTGIDAAHPALQGALHVFAEFDMAGDPIPGASPSDSGWHGTHTAGTIAGRLTDGTHFGVAPASKLASAIVIEGGDVTARLLGGMDWVIGEGARVLNMSLGIRGYTSDFMDLTQRLRERGVLPVFAVGNESAGTSRSPGNYAEALSVGACVQDDMVAGFSCSQTFARPDEPIVPDVVAPGVDILSCLPNGKYGQSNGSSMATPHISGLAALLLQAKPEATVDDIERAIFASCKRPTAMPKDRGNRGIPDAERALTNLLKK
jgi:subtilisin